MDITEYLNDILEQYDGYPMDDPLMYCIQDEINRLIDRFAIMRTSPTFNGQRLKSVIVGIEREIQQNNVRMPVYSYIDFIYHSAPSERIIIHRV